MTDQSTKATSIALDIMGGDLGPEEAMLGAKMALDQKWIDGKLILVGKEEIIEEFLEREKLTNDPRIEVFPASEVIGMDEKPIPSIKQKKDASLVRAIELVKIGNCSAAVSCGNTGSLMACSTIRLRPLEGVSKPALATVWPSRENHFVLLDAGANPQCKAENLFQYAVLGNLYAKTALNIENPRVGLLSIGTEEGKGNDLNRESHELLKKLGKKINYIGQIEGFQLFNNEVDVVVTDGFTGNIVLKSCESLWKMLKVLIKEEATLNPIRKIGALGFVGTMKGVKSRLNPDDFAGAPLLGLGGTVLKAHGSSNRSYIANAIRIAGLTIKADLKEQSEKDIAEANAILSQIESQESDSSSKK